MDKLLELLKSTQSKGYNKNETLIIQLQLLQAKETQIPYMMEQLDKCKSEKEYQLTLRERLKELDINQPNKD